MIETLMMMMTMVMLINMTETILYDYVSAVI